MSWFWNILKTFYLRDFYENGFGANNVEIMKQINWEYFYRWSPAEMASGRIWQVFNLLQGKSRTWYAGSSVGFESVRSVISYNDLLLKHSNIIS